MQVLKMQAAKLTHAGWPGGAGGGLAGGGPGAGGGEGPGGGADAALQEVDAGALWRFFGAGA